MLQPHQQRVVEESQELLGRIERLQAFTDSPVFAGLDSAERDRLLRQMSAMADYATVLAERINAFPQGATA
jgi:hypothetical protein